MGASIESVGVLDDAVVVTRDGIGCAAFLVLAGPEPCCVAAILFSSAQGGGCRDCEKCSVEL